MIIHFSKLPSIINMNHSNCLHNYRQYVFDKLQPQAMEQFYNVIQF